MRKTILSKVLAGSLLFYVFSGITSLLNYLFYPIVARFVTVSEYGEIQFLVSMFTQFAIGFIVLNILAIIISAGSMSTKAQHEAMASLNVAASLVTLVTVILGSLILYINQSNLGFHDGVAIIALGASLVISVPFTVAIGRLQGSGRFVASGVINALGSLFKLIFALVFIALGFGVTGAIFGIAAGMIMTLTLVQIVERRKSEYSIISYSANVRHGIRRLSFIKEQAAVAIITLTVVTLLSSADSIVSRAILNSHDAGLYAAVATLAKVILAVTTPLMWLALPPAVGRDRNQTIRLLIFTAITSSAVCGLFSLFPALFLKGLLSIDAGMYTSLLPLSSIAMVSCSAAFILVCVSVCLGTLRNITISTVAAVSCYALVLINLAPAQGLLKASLIGQMIAGSCFIIGGALSLRQRNFPKR